MHKLERPTEKNRLIDLVKDAGFDTSDWYKMANGQVKAASNPRYCYEWGFKKSDSILLNLWFDEIEIKNNTYFQNIALYKIPNFNSLNPTIKKRALRMFEYIQDAYKKKLPVRVIILNGKISDNSLNKKDTSTVTHRYLDDSIWKVSELNIGKKTAKIERNFDIIKYYDQHSIESSLPNKVKVTSLTYIRSQKIREKCLKRSNGKCEYCGKIGFQMSNGGVYLETHHIIPLSQMGKDNIQNIICLCANHHKEAHFSLHKKKMEIEFLQIINRN